MSDKSKIETKHTAYNLNTRDHPVFIDQQIIVDADGDVFMWINKYTGVASFSFKYFHIYKEQQLVEALNRFVGLSQQFLGHGDKKQSPEKEYKLQLQKALEHAEKALIFVGSDGEP